MRIRDCGKSTKPARCRINSGRSQFAAKISDGNENIAGWENIRGGKEDPAIAPFHPATFADSSPFSLRSRIRFAATAVSIIILDDRPDPSLLCLIPNSS